MTVSVQTNRDEFTGNGVTTAFATTFEFQTGTDLKVYLDGVLKTITTHYTVSGGSGSTGTVTFLVAPANGLDVVIYDDPPVTQGTDYTPNDDFPAESHELALDKVTRIARRIKSRVDRAAVLADFDTSGADTTLPTPSSRRAIVWNTAADGFENSTYDPDDAQADSAASAAAAAASASAAATSASNASTSATNAATSASNASTSETNSAASEAAAAASAVAAQAAADAVMWNDVVFKTFADSPITITNADTGKLFAIDCSGGAVTVDLPQISTLTLSTPWSIGFKKTESSANAVTINRAGTDTIDGATSLAITSIQGRVLIPDTDPAPDTWTSMQFGADALADGAVSTAKLADNAVTAAKLAVSARQQIQPISASVAADALTISASELSLDFRSTTLGSGATTRVTGTPANLVISSGSTLGTVNAVQSRIAILALNNAGTIELAAVNVSGGNDLSETGLISTTAEGGAGAADSASTIYSTTARASVAYRVIGYVESTQATAGTWATAPSTIQGAGGNAMRGLMTLGHGQTWQTVTRNSGTTYYNTTGRPIALQVQVITTAANPNLTVTVGGNTAYTTGAMNFGNTGYITHHPLIIIPPGTSYVVTVTNASITATELR